MSQEYNMSPYHNQNDPLATVSVTPTMTEHLRATKPWVRFLSIIMFIFSGLIFLGGIAVMFLPSALGTRGFGALIGIIYILMGGIYLVPAYFLFQYASYIQDFLKGGGDSAMESALGSQKSFWKFMGILMLIVIVIYALIIGLAIMGGLAALTR